MSFEEKKRQPKQFDQTVCFTCFAPWVEFIRALARDNPQDAIQAFLILADYCLYSIEPSAENNPWGLAWHLVSQEAYRSISNRRRGFGTENKEQTYAIKAYHLSHPQASQRAIADAVGCSLTKVNKVMKALKGVSGGAPIHGSDGSILNDSSSGTDNLSFEAAEQKAIEREILENPGKPAKINLMATDSPTEKGGAVCR